MQGGERVSTGAIGQVRGEDATVGQRFGEQPMIASAADFDAAKTRQMRCQKLGIEQTEAAEPQPCDKVYEGDLARVGFVAEHTFAEKGRTKRDAVQPAHQPIAAPAFDTVRGPAREERRVEPHDLAVDPGIRPFIACLGAGADDVFEGMVAADLEKPLAHHAAQPARHVEGVERQNPAAARIDPEQFQVVGGFRHRKNPGGISPDEKLGGQPKQARLRSTRTSDKAL